MCDNNFILSRTTVILLQAYGPIFTFRIFVCDEQVRFNVSMYAGARITALQVSIRHHNFVCRYQTSQRNLEAALLTGMNRARPRIIISQEWRLLSADYRLRCIDTNAKSHNIVLGKAGELLRLRSAHS